MGLQTLYRHPRRTTLRKVLFQLHLWVGVGVGIYAALIGLTGSLLVFRPEIQQATAGASDLRIDAGAPRLNAEAAANILRRAYPDRRLLTFLVPQNEREPYGAWLFKKSDALLAYVHPVTGEVLASDTAGMRFWNFVSRLHVDLLMGELGHVWSGALAVLLMIVLASGLVLWWQGVARWTRGLKVQFRSRWRRVNWDMHSAVGFWALPLLGIVTLTGIYFVWPKPFRAAVSALSPVAQKGAPPVPAASGSTRLATVDQIIAAAGAVRTQGRPGRVNLSESPGKAVRVVLYEGGATAHHRYGYLFLHPVTLALLRADVRESRSAGDSVIAWLPAIHFGSFGGYLSRAIWFALGLTLPLLFVTGFVMWWNRRLKTKVSNVPARVDCNRELQKTLAYK